MRAIFELEQSKTRLFGLCQRKRGSTRDQIERVEIMGFWKYEQGFHAPQAKTEPQSQWNSACGAGRRLKANNGQRVGAQFEASTDTAS
jgi:hypothetical protein